MKPREGEARLGNRARRGHNRDPALERLFLCGREQGRLADPRLAADDDRAAALLVRSMSVYSAAAFQHR